MTSAEPGKTPAAGAPEGESGGTSGAADTLSTALEARTAFAGDRTALSVGEYTRAYVNRIRGGDLGALPAMAGLIVLVIIFSAIRPTDFVSAGNFANLLNQAASITVLAMGVGFVLLLGEIDLSAGVIGGVGASISAQLIDKQDMVWWLTVIIAIAVGIGMGLLTGFLVTVVGIPSFVVTLAFFLAWQGVLLAIASQGGSIPVTNNVIVDLTHGSLSVLWSWILVIAGVLIWGGYTIFAYSRKQARGIAQPPLAVQLIKVGAVGVIAALATAALSIDRGTFGAHVAGIPWVVPFVGALLLIWSFIQSRTQFGRFVYAVGGNREASRRAGIRVPRIIIICFVISSGMAVLSGMIEASRIGSVTASSGTQNQLLFAVAAAVIGGTSLFGGRGKARDAIIGGLVIAIIPNGLLLITDSNVLNFIITGAVLLLAASVDAITRRRRASSGALIVVSPAGRQSRPAGPAPETKMFIGPSVAGLPADQATVRRHNLALLMRTLIASGPQSRARLADRTGLNKATVSSLVAELIKRRLVTEGAVDRGGTGRPGRRVELDTGTVRCVGLELNVDNAVGVVTDLTGQVLARRRDVAQMAVLGPARAIRRLADLSQRLLAECETVPDQVQTVHVSVPGLVDIEAETLTLAPNLHWRDVDVANSLRGRLRWGRAEFFADNDANLGAMAEYAIGASAGARHLLFVVGDIGVGAGIMIDGHIVRGRSGFAGEVGHMPLGRPDALCDCGRYGCWETAVGLRALLVALEPEPSIPADSAARLDEVVRRAEAGDARTLTVLTDVGHWLGIGMSVLANVLDPEVIVLGGHFSLLRRFLEPAVQTELAARVMVGGTRVEFSGFGFDAPVMGAAHAGIERIVADPTLVALG